MTKKGLLKRGLAVIACASTLLTSLNLQPLSLEALSNPKGHSGVTDTFGGRISGSMAILCPGSIVIKEAKSWAERYGVNQDPVGFVTAEGHNSGCIVVRQRGGGSGRHKDDLNPGYNVDAEKFGKQLRVSGEVWDEYGCDHFSSASWDVIDNFRYPMSGYVHRSGELLWGCNVCNDGHLISNIDTSGSCSGSPTGRHGFNNDTSTGVYRCYVCGTTRYVNNAVGGGCNHNHRDTRSFSMEWGTRTWFDMPDGSGKGGSSSKNVFNIPSDAKEYRETIKYGGSIDLTIDLKNTTKKISDDGVTSVVVTDVYWTKNGGTDKVAKWHAEQRGTLAGRHEQNDSDNSWTSSYTLSLSNVTESNNYYQCTVVFEDGTSFTTPKLYVDTTIIFFDYSPDDGNKENPLYYEKANLVDNTVASNLHQTDSVKDVANSPRHMVTSRALIPNQTYSYQSKDGSSMTLPYPVLYYRYNLFPRTINNQVDTGKDSKEDNNYSVRMNDDFMNRVFDFDDAQDTDIRRYANTTGTAESLLANRDYSGTTHSGSKATGVSLGLDNATGDRYRYSLYNVRDFKRWVISDDKTNTAGQQTYKLLVQTEKGFTKEGVVGKEVTDNVTPDGLGVRGLHWANAEYEPNSEAKLSLSAPDRYMAIVLDNNSMKGAKIVNQGEMETYDGSGNMTKQSNQYYNSRVTTTDKYTETDFHAAGNVQTAKGGTYTGTVIVPASVDVSRNLLTYRFRFTGWNADQTTNLVPIKHTHTGSAVDGSGCYTKNVYHVHTDACYTEGKHVHTEDCYEKIYHQHVGSAQFGGAGTCYEEPVEHKSFILDSTGHPVYTDAEKNPTKSGSYTKPVYHTHTGGNGGTIYSSTSPGGCYRAAGHTHNALGRCSTTEVTVEERHSVVTGCPRPHDPTAVVDYCTGCGKEWGAHTGPSYHVCGSHKETRYTCGSPTNTWVVGCGKNSSTIDWYVDPTPDGTKNGSDGWLLTCTKKELSYEMVGDMIVPTGTVEGLGTTPKCGIVEGTVLSNELTCGKTASTVEGHELGCGMTPDTIVGYEQVDEEHQARQIVPTDTEGRVSKAENLDMYASYEEVDLELPQLYKQGYEFLGWYTEPQEVVTGAEYKDTTDHPDGTTSTSTDGVVYNSANWAGGGYVPEKFDDCTCSDEEKEKGHRDGCPYQKSRVFREETVNMDNSNNMITLYAWFNRIPIYTDIYEGLFFEGQDVSLKDLTRLVGVFDYEDDYYNEAIKKIHALPEVGLKDIYLPVIVEQGDGDNRTEDTDNNDYTDKGNKEEEDDSKRPDKNESIDIPAPNIVYNPDGTVKTDANGNPVVEASKYFTGETYFDYSSWERVTSDASVVGGVQIQNGFIIAYADKDIVIGEKAYHYTAGQKIDGVYKYIGTNEDYKDQIYYTKDAKLYLESEIKGTTLELGIDSIKYYVKDGVALDTPEEVKFDMTTIPIKSYSNFTDIIENIKVNNLSTDITRSKPDYGLDTSTGRILRTDIDSRNWGGDFDVTYVVTDNGIMCGNKLIADSICLPDSDGTSNSDTTGTGQGIPNGSKLPDGTALPNGSSIEKINGSAITMKYTRKCRIDYNDNPLLYMQNAVLFNDFAMNLSDFKTYLIDRVVVLDAQDNLTNIPWWTKAEKQPKLITSISIEGVKDIKCSASLALELDTGVAASRGIPVNGVRESGVSFVKVDDLETWFNNTYADKTEDGFDRLMALKYASGDSFDYQLWRTIQSMDVIFDAYDQFGKYSSGKTTPYHDVDVNPAVTDTTRADNKVEDTSENEKYNPYQQIEDFRSSTVVLIDVGSDDNLTSANIKQEVRFISEEWVAQLRTTGSYYGSSGYGLEKLLKAFEKKETASKSEPTAQGSYKTELGQEVLVNVYDYATE